jgi:hypothetical protein
VSSKAPGERPSSFPKNDRLGQYTTRRPNRYVSADHAIGALRGRDAPALVGLASATERRAMNLDASTVRACLQETWWRPSGDHARVRVTGRRVKYADVLAYRVEVSGFVPNKPAQTEIDIYRDGTGRWRLGLSELLYITPKLCNGIEGDHARIWDAIARRAGIRGVTAADGGTRWSDGTFTPEVRITGR